MTIKRLPRRALTKGFSLVEVLVALLVLAVGLLGMLLLQTRGSQLNQSAYLQSQAMFLAEDIVERMRANVAMVENYDIDFGSEAAVGADACDDASSPCTAAEMVEADIAQWLADLTDMLPAGDGAVSVGDPSGNLYPVTVQVSYQQGETYTFQLEAML